MTTFDLAEVRSFVADLDAQAIRCQNGEGMECATLDQALSHQARLCTEFCERVRQWGREIFAGRLVLDPDVEMVWRTEGVRLHNLAAEMYLSSQTAEVPCYALEGRDCLLRALWNLQQMLVEWVSPRPSVSPSARGAFALDASTVQAAQDRVASLSPMPADWEPGEPQQQRLYRMLRSTS
jgi:hypothetical protein